MAKTKKELQNETNVNKKVTEPKEAKKSPKTAKTALKTQEKKATKVKLEPETKKEPLEPVVPADVEVDETPKIKEKAENVKKILAKEATKKASKKKKNKPAKIAHISTVGEKSDELVQIDSVEKTGSEKEYELFKKLLVAQKTRQLLWGEVYGVEPRNDKVIIAVLWNGVKITIPDSEYFEPSFDFGKRYNEASNSEKIKRRATFASYQNGARVCFLVKAVVMNPIKNGDFAGEHNIVCVASRKEAMELLRDINFYHKERVHALSNIKEVQIGSTADANVIAVKEDHIVVECLGVETRIYAHDTTCNEFVENCKDYFVPGQKIQVKILKIHINGTSSVYLKVTGKITSSSKLINTMELRSSYIGFVESVNNVKKIYNVRLKNGVLAGVLFSNVQGNVPLFIGNRVSVKVSKINDTYVYGSAMKL